MCLPLHARGEVVSHLKPRPQGMAKNVLQTNTLFTLAFSETGVLLLLLVPKMSNRIRPAYLWPMSKWQIGGWMSTVGSAEPTLKSWEFLSRSRSLGCKDAWHMGVIDHSEKEKGEPPPLIILVPMSMTSGSKWEAMDAWGGLITPKMQQTA